MRDAIPQLNYTCICIDTHFVLTVLSHITGKYVKYHDEILSCLLLMGQD